MHDGAPEVVGSLKIWNRIGKATGADAISLRVLEFEPGKSPELHSDEFDEVLYVLDGNCAVVIDSNAYEVGPETGVYVRPGQTLSVDNPGPDLVRIVSSQTPAKPAHASEQTPPIVKLADRKALPTADRWYRVLVDDEVGSKQVTQFVGSIPPGRAPDHFHEYEEVLFILRGEGRIWAGEDSTLIGPGSCVYLPRRQVHCVENTGTGELRLLGVFYPAGSPAVRYET
ncbi:MAG TPA: cupin domain-containing protein [Pyrinomonadaceae bacterium]|jgi:mannose-6-phosphate isomerase-like protein (cupin superfamily)|nr:cupin domain-containing protein [Pyrinomonadaceae bacterium]